jgi:hypothetical protein
MMDISLLIGELRAHREASEKRLDSLEQRVDQRFDRVEAKLSDLTKWKWKVAGGAAALTAIVGVVSAFAKLK